MNVIESKLLTLDDQCDLSYESWSRIYEYPFALRHLVGRSFHNTAWGWEGDHVRFREELDRRGTCVHSDIVERTLPTVVYDIREPKPAWKERFDTVLCISTLEHVDDRRTAARNLWAQVAPGGRLIVTCDYPDVTADDVCDLFGCAVDATGNLLTGANSARPCSDRPWLRVIGICLEKD